MPGRQAKKKLKKRQEGQAYRKQANANVQKFGEFLDKLQESRDQAPLADRKAMQARFCEGLEAMAAAGPDVIKQNVKDIDAIVQRHGELLSLEEAPESLKEFERKSRRALDALEGVNAICAHAVERPLMPVALCAAHPDQGLRCVECHQGHTDAHTVTEEHACDNCGRVNIHEIHPMTPVPKMGAVVRQGAEIATYPGIAAVDGLGLCRSCMKKHRACLRA